jgi:ribosomal protein S18 acetylase RimI-like enzyme
MASPGDGLLIQPVDFSASPVQGLLSEWNGELVDIIQGFEPGTGSLVDESEFDGAAGFFLLATVSGSPAGCGGVRSQPDGAGEVKRLYVRPSFRGAGLGRALLKELEAGAHDRGFPVLRLDTDGHQPAALGLFRSAGYKQVEPFNASPYARFWFEKKL